eukprot:TRINITY_DN12322_c0_g1_i1.p1 TRINITY_DN12322_c0_g1~~TRINITY_DN12322_c0_g1_i1.p1  ORF type:complete len:624 (-),score=113.75 TRINITY_DN12322_c0_g1_i1:17-1888(-)
MTFVMKVQTSGTGDLVCSVITPDGKYVIFSSTTGEIYKFNTETNTVVSTLEFTGESFGGGCVRRKSGYGLFAGLSSGLLYQINFNGDLALTNPLKMGGLINGPNSVIATAAADSNEDYAYFSSYKPANDTALFIPALPVRNPEAIFEVVMTNTTWGVRSIVQDYNRDWTYFLCSAISLNGTLFVGSAGLKSGRRLDTTISPETSAKVSFITISQNATTVPEVLYTENFSPVMYDTSATTWQESVGPIDIKVTNGVPATPLVAYIRGIDEFLVPNDVSGITIKWVSIDEQSTAINETVGGTTRPKVIRSTPFLGPNDAPWLRTRASEGLAPSISWVVGNPEKGTTSNPMLPFYISGTTTSTRNVKRQFDPTKLLPKGTAVGYVEYDIEYITYDVNNEATQQIFTWSDYGASVNYTGSMLEIRLTIVGWDFLDSQNQLKINLVVNGNGLDRIRGIKTNQIENDGTNKTVNLPLGVDSFFHIYELTQSSTTKTRIVLPQVALVPFIGDAGVPYQPIAANMRPRNGTQQIELVFPKSAGASGVQIYSYYIFYDYTPPIVTSSSSSADDVNLLPLWIVIGVVGGICVLCIIALLIALLVFGIIKYKRHKEKQVENVTKRSEHMLEDAL